MKPTFERTSIGDNVRKFRLEAKMTQKDLADAMGYKSPSTIAKIESGENSVDIDTCRKLASILNVSPVMLSGLETDEGNEGYIAELYRRLPRSGKLLLMRQAAAIEEMFLAEGDDE